MIIDEAGGGSIGSKFEKVIGTSSDAYGSQSFLCSCASESSAFYYASTSRSQSTCVSNGSTFRVLTVHGLMNLEKVKKLFWPLNSFSAFPIQIYSFTMKKQVKESSKGVRTNHSLKT